MGNVLLEGTRKGADPAEEYQRWLEENPDLVGKEILGENKLFRTSCFRFNGRNIIVKVFFKRDQSSLIEYLKIFEFFNQLNEKHKATNIAPLRLFTEKDNQYFVVAYRQKMCHTLEEVLTAKPTPNESKKKWMIYQMIRAVYTVHKIFNFYHGNIRTSNFIVTTYGYLMLTDFAFYKPNYMFEDSEQYMPEFRLFYGSSITNCTLAPEKITDQNNLRNKERSPAKLFASYQPFSAPQSSASFSVTAESSSLNASVLETMTTNVGEISIPPSNLSLTASMVDPDFQKQRSLDDPKNPASYAEQVYSMQKMDMFSLGCSILEVLRDGKPLMNYESYLIFKKGEISLDPFIEDACKDIENGEEIKGLLKSMLELNPENRSNIEEVTNNYNKIINMNTYSLVWHCTSTFSTTSFLLPDLRIALIYSIFKFIEVEERGVVWDYKIRLPKCFQFFEPLKLFKSIFKNKIILSGFIPDNSILRRILDSNEKEDIIDSEEEEIINEEGDARKEFFVPLVAKKKDSSLRSSTATIPKVSRTLCPPEWNRDLMKLIETKYKGVRLTPKENLKNRFQDLLEEYKKNQNVREARIKQSSKFYNQYSMVIRLIFTCIRSCKYNSSKLIGIELMMSIAKESEDSTKLSKIIPRLISLLDDPDSMTSRYAFNSIVDVFYTMIDPFKNEEDTNYYEIIIEMFINCLKTGRLRISLFKRLGEIYSICEWLEVHIKKLCKKVEAKISLRDNLIEAIKGNFGNYTQHEIRELMMNIPDLMWPDMFEFFISFLNSEKILGLEKSISITQIDTELHKKIIDVIDNCIESGLDETGISLYYAIKYFTHRKVCVPSIVKKIALMVIHPHLWVRDQAKEYLEMCLEENPPTRIFLLFREIFEPPFPLQPKDIIDDILLPHPLLDNEVDFSKKKIKDGRKIGLTEKLFLEYLEKVKPSKSYPIAKESEKEEWHNNAKSLYDQKIEPTHFHNFIKKSIYELFEANFLYYVGNAKSPFKHYQKEEDKRRVYEELHEALKKMGISSLEENQLAYEKKDFFTSLSTIMNSNFEKLLTRFMKEDKTNKIRISESMYLIMETLYKFEQFNIKQVFKLGEFPSKTIEPEKPFRPKGNLITEIYEHKDVITCLENIADKFLVSGSYDGTIKVFNVRKIEVNITCESEGTYEINADNNEEKVRINSLAAFDSTYTIAAATNKGNIRVFQIERMRGKVPEYSNRLSRGESSGNSEVLKYHAGGEVEKVVTFKNENRNECFCFITSESILGVQDIRMRTKTMTCNLGKERGIPRALAFSTFGPSILVGTLDGYVLNYDIRCNLVSTIRQLQYENNPVTITGIYPSPYVVEGRNLFGFTYPSKYYECSYFDLFSDSGEFLAERHYSSCDREDIITVPSMTNKTKEENFKLCNNSLTQKKYYKQLADFRNFKILEYLSDPCTIKESKVREMWMDRCKHRYNQISSIFNKKSLPFLEHLPHGIMTNMNPCISCPGEKKSNRNLSVLVDRVETKEYYECEKLVSCKPANSKIHLFPDEENADYLTSCKIVNGMVFAGGWDSVIKIYK